MWGDGKPRSHEAAVVVGFAAITATALLAAPAIAAQLASEWHLTPSAIGIYFTVEQAGMCLAALPAIWWLRVIPWRAVTTVAMVFFTLANLSSAMVSNFGLLLALRAVSSLSGGSLMVLSMTMAGRSANSERLFGLWVLGQLTVGAVLLITLPRLFTVFGLSILYLILVGLMAAASLLLRGLPTKASEDADDLQRVPLDPRALIRGIGAVLLYYIGFGGVWPFMAVIASAGGTNAITSGTVLAIGSLFGIGGASLATAFARRKSQRVLGFGCLLLVLAIVLLFHAPSLLRFAAAAFLLKAASNFTLPFILGRIAAVDGDGRLMSLTNMAIGGGLAVGPLLAGGIIDHGGGLPVMVSVSALLILLSTLLILSLQPRAETPTAALRLASQTLR